MSDQRKLPFEERASQNYQDEMKNLKKVEALLRKGKQRSEIEAYREPLSYDGYRQITVLLSWGGPSDGYKVLFDKDNEPTEGSYFFADWFEYKEFQLSKRELDVVLAVYFQHERQ